MTKLASVVLIALAACKGSDRAPATSEAPPPTGTGKERGDCVAGANGSVGTCDPGLLCLSNLCVRPPPADCQAVADYMATMELGNYAELDVRQPLIVKYKGACVAAKISSAQGECLTKAKEQFAAWQCAPAMFPGAIEEGKAACGPAIANLRTTFTQSLGVASAPLAPGDIDPVEIILAAMRASCEEDGWPAALLHCMQSARSDPKQLMVCNNQMPPELQQKLAQRVSKAVAEAQRQQGVAGGNAAPPPPPPPNPAN